MFTMPKRIFLTLVWIYIFSVAIADDGNGDSRFSELTVESTQAAAIISLINNAKSLLEDVKMFAIVKRSYLINKPEFEKPMDCADIQEKDPYAKSGVHRIWPHSRVTEGPIDVYCDLEDDGGAWTVIQRRGDFNRSADYFYKDWESYKFGFGGPEKDHWIGNKNIFALTNQRANIVKFTLSDWVGNSTFAMYDEFWVEDESRNYMMHVSGYRGTAGDSFSNANRMAFSTKDQDNDKDSRNCAVEYKGAWWYNSCLYSNLNGMYLKGVHKSPADGVNWHGFRGLSYSLKDSVIKIRPEHFKKSSYDSTL